MDKPLRVVKKVFVRFEHGRMVGLNINESKTKLLIQEKEEEKGQVEEPW
jgi:hypothetical protein